MSLGKVKLVAIVGLIVLAGIWILQNGNPVQTKFLFITVTMPQSALLALTLLTGMAAGILLALGQSGRRDTKVTLSKPDK